jgi:PHS family inorganic phosphate transporter-like MFS transporter
MWLFIGIFTLAQLICNAGPNTTVFVIPAEVFPTRIRSTTYGFSAAFGKLGAAISESKRFLLIV